MKRFRILHLLQVLAGAAVVFAACPWECGSVEIAYFIGWTLMILSTWIAFAVCQNDDLGMEAGRPHARGLLFGIAGLSTVVWIAAVATLLASRNLGILSSKIVVTLAAPIVLVFPISLVANVVSCLIYSRLDDLRMNAFRTMTLLSAVTPLSWVVIECH